MTKQETIDARNFLNKLAEVRLQSLLEARILFTIAAAAKPMAVGELAEALDTPLSTISRIVWALVEDKLLAYEDDPTDRRRKMLTAGVEPLSRFKFTKK